MWDQTGKGIICGMEISVEPVINRETAEFKVTWTNQQKQRKKKHEGRPKINRK